MLGHQQVALIKCIQILYRRLYVKAEWDSIPACASEGHPSVNDIMEHLGLTAIEDVDADSPLRARYSTMHTSPTQSSLSPTGTESCQTPPSIGCQDIPNTCLDLRVSPDIGRTGTAPHDPYAKEHYSQHYNPAICHIVSQETDFRLTKLICPRGPVPRQETTFMCTEYDPTLLAYEQMDFKNSSTWDYPPLTFDFNNTSSVEFPAPNDDDWGGFEQEQFLGAYC
jgi:hypothetical protein